MISSSGESPSSSTSKRPRSSSTPAGAIGSRTRTRGPWPAPAPGGRSPPPPAPLAAAGTGLSESVLLILSSPAAHPPQRARNPRQVSDRRPFCVDLERAARGDAALDRRPELAEHELDRRQRRRDVELVVPADVADPEDGALQLALPAGDRDAVPLPQRECQLAGVHPVRDPRSRDHGGAVLVRGKKLQPHRSDPGTAGAAEANVPLERRVQAALEQEGERDVERD